MCRVLFLGEEDLVSIKAFEAIFVGNVDFDLIDRSQDVFCPFEAIGMVKQEIRHANFLAYCLDPHRPHGFGNECIKAFVRAAAVSSRDGTELTSITPLDVHLMDFDGVDIKREWRNIDLLMIVNEERLVIAVELKIDSGEHSNQLSRYRDIVQNQWPICDGWQHLFVFLTKDGDVSEDYVDWVPLSLAGVALEFDNVVQRQVGSHEARGLLSAYLAMLRRHHVMNEELEKVASRLWSQHKEALDFLMERRPGADGGISGMIYEQRQEIAERLSIAAGLKIVLDDCTARLLRFAVVEWDCLAGMKSSNGWTSSNRILLLEGQWNSDRTKLSMRFVLGPGPQEIRQQMYLKLQDAGAPTSSRREITSVYTRLATEVFRVRSDAQQDDLQSVERLIGAMQDYVERIGRQYHEVLTSALKPKALDVPRPMS